MGHTRLSLGIWVTSPCSQHQFENDNIHSYFYFSPMEQQDFSLGSFSLPLMHSRVGLWLNSSAPKKCFPLWVGTAAAVLPTYENCEFIQQIKVSPCTAEHSNEMLNCRLLKREMAHLPITHPRTPESFELGRFQEKERSRSEPGRCDCKSTSSRVVGTSSPQAHGGFAKPLF